MQPGERVDAIRQVVDYFAELDWADARLIATEFGTDDPATRVGHRREIFLEILRDAPDATLMALLSYVRGETEPVPPGGLVPWRDGSFRLFISHTTAHREWVGRFKTSLANFCIDGFVAHVDIEPTSEWMQTIEGALSTCDALVAVLTDDFHESKWTDQEVGYAIARHVLIVPIAQGLMPYGLMSRYQAITDAVDAEPGVLSYRLMRLLLSRDLTEDKMSDALVYGLEHSDSFNETRRLMNAVEQIAWWTPQRLRRLERALDNYEVSQEFNAPSTIRAILSQHGRGLEEEPPF